MAPTAWSRHLQPASQLSKLLVNIFELVSLSQSLGLFTGSLAELGPEWYLPVSKAVRKHSAAKPPARAFSTSTRSKQAPVVLFVFSVWPEPRSSAAGVRDVGLMDAIANGFPGCSIHAASPAKAKWESVKRYCFVLFTHALLQSFNTVDALCFLDMLSCACARSKAWLAACVSLRLARTPRTASSAQRSRRLRSTHAAAPVLLAHAVGPCHM